MATRMAPKRRAKSGPPVQPKVASGALPSGDSSARAAAASVALPRISKGRRPQFYDQVAIDQLMAIVTALTAETSVAFDRIDTLERLLAAAGVLETARVESYRPNADIEEARRAKREELIRRVFAVFDAYGANRGG